MCSDRPPPAPVKRRCWPRWWNPCPDGTAGSRYASMGFSLCLGFGLCDRGTRWSPPWARRRAARRVRWLNLTGTSNSSRPRLSGENYPSPRQTGVYDKHFFFSGIIRLFAQIRLSTSYPKILGVSDFPGLTNEQSTIYPESRSDPSNRAPRLRASSSLTLSASCETSSALCSV